MSLIRRKRSERKPLKPEASNECPFCRGRLPSLALSHDVFTGEGRQVGRCTCGAVFAFDETGRAGGAALMDALTLLTDGDLDQAMTLEAGVDYDEHTILRRAGPRSMSGSRSVREGVHPRLWCLRRRQ